MEPFVPYVVASLYNRPEHSLGVIWILLGTRPSSRFGVRHFFREHDQLAPTSLSYSGPLSTVAARVPVCEQEPLPTGHGMPARSCGTAVFPRPANIPRMILLLHDRHTYSHDRTACTVATGYKVAASAELAPCAHGVSPFFGGLERDCHHLPRPSSSPAWHPAAKSTFRGARDTVSGGGVHSAVSPRFGSYARACSGPQRAKCFSSRRGCLPKVA
ncbi:hypothetical protein C8Q77DRAFT_219430 [Trametes polyzona]|nr:hypothetical protein C8Q77DRAFT_219430 [Trametes polyzona]